MHKAVVYAVTGVLMFWLTISSQISHADPEFTPNWTKVEKKFLAKSGRQSTYPHEYVPVLETVNQYELGKLTALRFIEWAITNPNGVIALTSGTTPEFFIKFLHYYKKNWHKPQVQAELHSYGIKLKNFPDTSNMKLVQLEEFFPISPKHSKNVSNYIKRFYIKLLGLKKENVLLMDLTNRGILAEKGMKVVFMNGKIDLSIMKRKASSQLELWQQQAIREAYAFCAEYEKKIRAWGGIDFFLGSLGYGGHLGFNKPGSAFDNKTHIVKLDYRAAAHAAKDLGGIEYARGKVAVTIGLGTMTIKPDAVLIIIAAGEVKAPLVRDSVENLPDPQFPGTVLQKYRNSRFYVNSGAAKLLQDRITANIKAKSKNGWSAELIQEVIIDVALAEKVSVNEITPAILSKYDSGKLLLQTSNKPLATMLAEVRASLEQKFEQGLNLSTTKAQKILHTGPHHDDIILGYHPLLENLIPKYQNRFVYVTSGFNSVADSYILATINRASDWWLNKEEDTIFSKPYEKVVSRFRSYFLKQDIEQMNMLDTTIALKHLVEIYDIKNLDQLKQTIRWLKDEYFPNKQPGDMDVASIKLLKGMIRESEADRQLLLKNIPLANVTHLRSKFYTGKEFITTPRIDSDVMPFVKLYNSYEPDVITVEDDPQSAPPVTHYKALQVVAQALRNKEIKTNNNLQIWGYRNVWFRYRPQEANIYVPVSEKMIDSQRKVFMACYNTQKSASYPSPFFEGDFSLLTSMIQKDQLAELKILLGADYFAKSAKPELKNAVGVIYLKQMPIDEFLLRAEDLQQAMALEESFETA